MEWTHAIRCRIALATQARAGDGSSTPSNRSTIAHDEEPHYFRGCLTQGNLLPGLSPNLPARACARVEAGPRVPEKRGANPMSTAMRQRWAVRNVFPGLALFVLAGCASTTPIGKLLAEPGRYDGREVRVQGTVTRSAGVLGVGAYEMEDGTGSIVVVARGQGVPAQGAHTRVKGTFQSVFSLMGRTIAAILQTGQ
jgi:hypothetical protein